MKTSAPPSKPVVGAAISLSQGGTKIASTTSAAKGDFSFGSLPPGSYLVMARAPNGATGTVSATVSCARPVNVTIYT